MSEEFVRQQYAFEIESWTRMMNFISQENINYKNRLAEVLNSDSLTADLPRFEYFNEEFISQDKIVEYLKAELKKHHKLLQEETSLLTQLKQIKLAQEKLRREVKVEEELFQHLKEEFSAYLTTAHTADRRPPFV